MFPGLPGGSPGPNAQAGCLGASIVVLIGIAVAAAFFAMVFWVTNQIDWPRAAH